MTESNLFLGALLFFLLFIILVVGVYVDSLHFLYYKKVEFTIEDIKVTYWYKWKWFTSRASPYFIWRKIKLHNTATGMKSEYILDPVREKGHILYFYFDHNYETHTGMLFDALVIRDSDISMGFDVYSLDDLGRYYVYERRTENTEYLGMIEGGEFFKSEGMFRNVDSSELNY